jgi:hypothetical protein
MPKQKTDDLVQLINSLTRAEKRHFRLFVKRNQSSEDILFLQLFDFLEKRGEYDEETILKRLPEIKKQQMSNLKAHLYKQLLTSLRLLSAREVPDIQIREMVDYARVLYNKGLYRQSLDILAKAKERSKAAGYHPLQMEVLEFEKHIEGQYITRSIEGRAEALTEETLELGLAMQQMNLFSNLSLQLYGLYLKVGFTRNEKDFFFVKEFFAANSPKIPWQALDFMGKLYFCQAHFWFYHITQDFGFCYRYAQRWADLFRDNPHMAAINMPLYLKGLHNLLNSLFNLLHAPKFNQALDELLGLPARYPELMSNKNNESLFFLYKYIHLLKKHFLEGTFTEGLGLVPELLEIMEEDRYNWDSHREMVFYYRIASLFFGSGDSSNAITYLNYIINEKDPDYRADIQVFARLLSLIAHYELGNAQLLEYQVKSVYRFLAKKEDLGMALKEIFKFLRRLTRIHPRDLPAAFIALKVKLEKIALDPYEQRPFLYLDILSWLDSKIEHRPVQEVIRQKYLQRQHEHRSNL